MCVCTAHSQTHPDSPGQWLRPGPGGAQKVGKSNNRELENRTNVCAEVPGVNKHLHVTLKCTERRWIACAMCSAKIICISLSSRKHCHFTGYLFLEGHLIYCFKSSEITQRNVLLLPHSPQLPLLGLNDFALCLSFSGGAKPKVGALLELFYTVETETLVSWIHRTLESLNHGLGWKGP